MSIFCDIGNGFHDDVVGLSLIIVKAALSVENRPYQENRGTIAFFIAEETVSSIFSDQDGYFEISPVLGTFTQGEKSCLYVQGDCL